MRGRYRVVSPALAMSALYGRHEAVTVPAGGLLDLEDRKFNGGRIMEVLWEGRTVLMFTGEPEVENGSLTAPEALMVGKRRLLKTTLGIVIASRLQVMIQPGSILEILEAPQEGEQLVEVILGGEPTMMFIRDVLERSERIDSYGQAAE